MKRHALRVVDYLGHIDQAIERIRRYTGDMDEAAFMQPQAAMAQDAVIRNMEIVGEAAKNIRVADPDFAALNKGLPLHFAYEMRNVLAHGYHRVDLAIVWRTARQVLPDLQEQVQTLIAALTRDDHEPL